MLGLEEYLEVKTLHIGDYIDWAASAARPTGWLAMKTYTFDFDEIDSQEDFIGNLSGRLI